jgi:plasmid stability protein
MNLTIKLPDEDVPALKANATTRGVSEEQYALQVLEQDLAPEWLRQSWASAKEAGLDRLSMDEIGADIAAARKARRETKPQPTLAKFFSLLNAEYDPMRFEYELAEVSL